MKKQVKIEVNGKPLFESHNIEDNRADQFGPHQDCIKELSGNVIGSGSHTLRLVDKKKRLLTM